MIKVAFRATTVVVAILFSIIIVAAMIFAALNLFSSSSVLKTCILSGGNMAFAQEVGNTFEKLKLSGTFLVSKNGSVLARGYCGTSDPKTNLTIQESTIFNIGSVSKQFTGYLLHELIREQKVFLEDSLATHISELSHDPVGKVTIRQLMRMRGGIPYVPPMRKFIGFQLTNRIHTQSDMLNLISDLGLEFQPDTNFNYSNLGYSLIAILIERIEQATWGQTLQKRIFGPFKMLHSANEGDQQDRPGNLAVGLIPLNFSSASLFLKLPHWNYSMIKGAGGIVSNANDLHLWNQALWDRASNDSNWAETYFPQGLASDENYSFGWFLSESKIKDGKSVQTINHGGEDPGYCASVTRIPSVRGHIIITSNSDYCIFRDGTFRPIINLSVEHLVGEK